MANLVNSGILGGFLDTVNRNMANDSTRKQNEEDYEMRLAAANSAKAKAADDEDQREARKFSDQTEEFARMLNNGEDPTPGHITAAHMYLKATGADLSKMKPEDLSYLQTNLGRTAQTLNARFAAKSNVPPAAAPLQMFPDQGDASAPSTTPDTSVAPPQTPAPDGSTPAAPTPPTDGSTPMGAVNASSVTPPAATPTAGGQDQSGIALPGPNPNAAAHTPPPQTPHDTAADAIPLDKPVQGEAYLQTLNPAQASRIRALYTGREKLTAYMQRNKDLMNQLYTAYPDFNSQSAAVMQRVMTGKDADNLQSINTAILHIQTGESLIDALNNGKMQDFNRIANWYSQKTGSPIVTNFASVRDVVGDELIKSIVGGTQAVADREELKAKLDAANSPAQLKQAFMEYKQLMAGRIEPVMQRYTQFTHNDDFMDKLLVPQAKDALTPLLSPEARKLQGIKDKEPVAPPTGTQDQSQPSQPAQAKAPEPTDLGLQHGAPASLVMQKLQELKLPPGTQFKLPDGRIGTVPQPPQQQPNAAPAAPQPNPQPQPGVQ